MSCMSDKEDYVNLCFNLYRNFGFLRYYLVLTSQKIAVLRLKILPCSILRCIEVLVAGVNVGIMIGASGVKVPQILKCQRVPAFSCCPNSEEITSAVFLPT